MNLKLVFVSAAFFFLTAAAAQENAVVRTNSPPVVTENPAPARDSTEASSVPANQVGHELTAEDVKAWLDGLLTYGLKSGDIAGVAVAVVKDGQVLFQGGYGYADIEKKTPMDAERVMVRIGSTSKLFTWTAVMQQVEQGKLELDRNVDDYLDFKVSPTNGKPITLLDLMHHRGGFEEGLKDILAIDPARLQTTETYLKEHPRPLLFAPGTVPAYSNYGTALAGYIVERISGEPYERYIDKHILLPLGMENTTFDQPLPERFKGQVALGYRAASMPAEAYELIVTRAAGSATATAADMARFMLAHLQNGRLGEAQILREETAQRMHSPSQAALPGFSTMAHGFFHGTHNGRTAIGHGGDTVMFHSELNLLPEEGVGIFYSFNSRGRDEAVYALRASLFNQFMDRYFPRAGTLEEPPALASAAVDAQRIAGRYESSRRIEHGFLSIFYLLQQTVISANPDGTISAPKAFEPGEARFRAVAADIWREIGGSRQLALRNIDGVKTVIDSEDPTSVLQAVPGRRSASLNLTVLLGSVAILIFTLILWPAVYLLRRRYQRLPAYSVEVRRLRLFLRIAVVFDLLWIVAWIMTLMPVLSLQLDFYSTALDPTIRALQIAGLIVIALGGAGIWMVWRLWRLEAAWLPRIANGAIAAALLGLVWIGWIGGLLQFNLNY
jgi:CubicO group peptidase (beta-lactamase class C family)